MQNDYSEFEDLLHKMVSKKPVMKKEVSYINVNGESKLSTVSVNIKEFLSIIKVEN